LNPPPPTPTRKTLCLAVTVAAPVILGRLAAGGGLILATRDRIVWRMHHDTPRLKFLHQQANRTHLPQKPNALASEMPHSPHNYVPIILTRETASGRSKKHFLHDCELAPGRDATERLLRIWKLRGAFVVGLLRLVILGEREQETGHRSLAGAECTFCQ